MGYFDKLLADDLDANAIDKKNFKEQFFLIMAYNEFDFTDVDEDSKLPKCLIPVISNKEEMFIKFNMVLSKLHRQKIINILDAVSFIVADYIDAPILLKCLDEMNFILLKNELSSKFNINKKEESLSILDFLK